MMDISLVALRNEKKSINSAEEAIDFNFNEFDEVDNTTDDLGIPFLHNLKRPILPGDLVLLEGSVKENAISFRIDFCTNEDNIVVHINPRLDQNYIARNSFIEDHWGEEEGCAVTRSPIARGRPFQIQIFVLENEYLVCVNGQHMFKYAHRLPPSEVSKIEIFGDIHLTSVGLVRSNVYPHPIKEKFRKPVGCLEVPLTRYIKHGLGTFGKILLTGRIKYLPVSFYINIQSTDMVYPHPKVIYHLNVRYCADWCVVQNSWGLRGPGWDEEIRTSIPLALLPGKTFSFSIITTNSYIQTRGADWDLPLFYHRMNPDSGKYIHIEGDIILNSLQIFPDNDNESVF